MLLIDDDEAKIGKRSKDGASGTDGDPCLPPLEAHPFLPTLRIGQMAVKHGHSRTAATRMVKPGSKPLDRLGSERNLGHQDNGAFARIEHCAECPEVDLRLAASGHPVQKERSLGHRVVRSADRLEKNRDNRFLVGIELGDSSGKNLFPTAG